MAFPSSVTSIRPEGSQDEGHSTEERLHQYEPLRSPQHIRLLRLAPGDVDAPLTCTLVQVSLDRCRPYKAISYTWGDSGDRIWISCDGLPVAITRKLFEALSGFRHRSHRLYLWADAICIDQDNVLERNAQVQLMARIYSQASTVLLWVCKADPQDAHAAFGFLTRLLQPQLTALRQRGSWMSTNDMWKLVNKDAKLIRPVEDALKTIRKSLCTILVRLLSSPCFQRGWIVQEFALASSLVVCWGEAHMDVNWFYHGLRLLIEPRNSPISSHVAQLGFSCLYSMYSIRLRTQDGVSRSLNFLKLLDYTRVFSFGDKRDRVYGLLALQGTDGDAASAQLSGATAIQADYAVDEHEAYKKVAVRCLIRENRLDTLLSVHHEERIDSNRSSWVPEWKEWSWVDLYQNYQPKRNFWGPGKVELVAQQKAILIQGLRIGVVDEAIGGYTIFQSDKQLQDLLSRLQHRFDPACVAFSATAGKRSPSIVSPYIQGPPGPLEKERLKQTLMDFLALDLTQRSVQGKSAEQVITAHIDVSQFRADCRKFLPKKTFFATANRTLGLGPSIVQKNDVLVLLLGDVGNDKSARGNYLPFILRPTDRYYWRLVGPCFVYDVITDHIAGELRPGGVGLQRNNRAGRIETFIIY